MVLMVFKGFLWFHSTLFGKKTWLYFNFRNNCFLPWLFLPSEQGCLMVDMHTINHNFDIFWKALGGNILIHCYIITHLQFLWISLWILWTMVKLIRNLSILIVIEMKKHNKLKHFSLWFFYEFEWKKTTPLRRGIHLGSYYLTP
jgi:hypothetical protein